MVHSTSLLWSDIETFSIVSHPKKKPTRVAPSRVSAWMEKHCLEWINFFAACCSLHPTDLKRNEKSPQSQLFCAWCSTKKLACRVPQSTHDETSVLRVDWWQIFKLKTAVQIELVTKHRFTRESANHFQLTKFRRRLISSVDFVSSNFSLSVFLISGWLGALSTAVALFISPLTIGVCKRKSTRLTAVIGGLVTWVNSHLPSL